jgi:tetratricopeptide (TPR) repeat protein
MQYHVADVLGRAARYLEAGQLEEARQHCARIVSHDPTQPDALNMLGVIALRCGQHHEALASFATALRIRPTEALYHYNMGLAYRRAGARNESVHSLRAAVKYKPDLAPAWSDLCLALTEIGELEAACAAGNEAIRLAPENFAVHTNLAVALEASAEYGAAYKHYKRAAELAPDQAVVHKNLALSLIGMGDKVEAVPYLRTAIRLDPSYAEAYRHLVDLTEYDSLENPDAEDVRRLLSRDDLNSQARAELHFALGKMHDDCDDWAQAFWHFAEGNRMMKSRYAFDAHELQRRVDRLISFFSPRFMKQRIGSGHPSRRPVLVVGMPRSGTTLVQQMIASHPRAFGAGELRWWASLEHGLTGVNGGKASFPECLSKLSHDTTHETAERYLAYLRRLNADTERVVDKMPENFIRLGLIRLFFDNVRVIHCQRDPMATGFSIFRQFFPGNIHWGYDLNDIGTYYRQYARIMQHWTDTMPENILNIRYEDMVNDTEAACRRIIEFVGLPWDPACMDFYRRKTHVHTASSDQVRRPIYTDSLERWRNYESFLAPLRHAIATI